MKWICFLNERAYDPALTPLPAEMQGAAVCRFVEDHEYEAFLRRNRHHAPRLKAWDRIVEAARKVLKACGCGGTRECE